MRYPNFVKKGDTIGVTAPSAGIAEEFDKKTLDNAKKQLEKMGFSYLETKNVRTDIQGRSSTGKERAEQFLELWNKEEVSMIIAASGGDFLAEMLDYIDWETLKRTKPKWVQGYSDVTGILFLLTTMLDIATVYGENIKKYGMEPLHKSLVDGLELLQGKKIEQKSFEKYETRIETDNPYEPYHLTEKVEWKGLRGEKEISFEGRCIGGCLDVIINLIGTKYDKVADYIEKYKEDGIVWYLEVFEMTSPQVFLHLWQLKQAGYFKYCKGILFGRPLMIREDYGMKQEEAMRQALEDMNIPIIYDVDIGHVKPQITMINGAIAKVNYLAGKGKIRFEM